MPSLSKESMYQPPGFEPVHFDDRALPTVGTAPARWLSSWQGRIGDPAEQIALGWGLDAETVIVVATCTIARLPQKPDRRQDAVFQALGGAQIGSAKLSGRQRHQAIEQARSVADFEPVELTADDTVCTGAMSSVQGFLVGHVRVGTRVATFAARGMSADQIRLRTLDTTDGYAIDPRAMQAIADIEAHQPAFVVP